jgi:hypothetical protein
MFWVILAATAAAGLNAGSSLQYVLLDRTQKQSGVYLSEERAISNAFWQLQLFQAYDKVHFTCIFCSVASTFCSVASMVCDSTAPSIGNPMFAAPGFYVVACFDAFVMGPMVSAVSKMVHAGSTGAVSSAERAAWRASFYRKSLISAGLSVIVFGYTLVLLMESGSDNASSDKTCVFKKEPDLPDLTCNATLKIQNNSVLDTAIF